MQQQRKGQISKLCKEQGCQFTAVTPDGRCSIHAKMPVKQDRAFAKKLPTETDPFYTSVQWRRCREAYLSTHPTCENPGCNWPAQEVHHKQRREEHPELSLMPSNLKALCRRCHLAESAAYKGPGNDIAPGVGVRVAVPTIFVYGPPAAGKTTLINKHRKPNELVIDVDALLSACLQNPSPAEERHAVPFAVAARNAMLKRLFSASALSKVWVAITAMEPKERRYWAGAGASVWLLLPPKEQVKAQAKADTHRGAADWGSIVDRWYGNYVAVESDVVVTTA